jgi:hypothetical protein
MVVLPVVIKVRNTGVTEVLRYITEASVLMNAVTTEWMLTWLLTVKYCSDVFLFKLCDDIVFSHQFS